MGDLTIPLMIVAAVLLLMLFIRIIRLPLKLLAKAALHAAVGFVALFVLNFLGSWIGVNLEMNLFNALVAGILGVPGVLILLIFKYVL